MSISGVKDYASFERGGANKTMVVKRVTKGTALAVPGTEMSQLDHVN